MSTLDRIKQVASGARVLADWLGEGGEPVSQEEADKRTLICANCPLNDRQTGWIGNVTAAAARAILEQQRVKFQLRLRTDNEVWLGTCTACGCHLPLKVWVPREHIMRHTESLEDFHPKCWLREPSK